MMAQLFEQVAAWVAPWTLVVDGVLLALVVLLCLCRHFHPLVVLRQLLADARPLVGVFVVIVFVFVNLFALAWYVGDSSMRYGAFCHFFNVTDQQVELAEGGGDAAFFIACATAIAGNFLLSGVFVSVLVNVIDGMAARLRHGLVQPRVREGCVAILGYRPGMTEALLLQLLREPEKNAQVVLLTEGEVPKLRLALRAALPERIHKHLTLVHGGWTGPEDLRQLRLWRCRDIYVLGEEGESNHDSLCLKALDVIQQLLSEHRLPAGAPKPVCHILWEEWDFINIMLTSDIATFISEGHSERMYDVRTYHPHSMLATNTLIAKGWHAGDNTLCPPLDRISFLQEPGRRVHFIIIGMSSFGRALLRAAIQQAHYPNYAQDKSRRTLISIIDVNAEEEMERLRNQHPLLFEHVRYEHRRLSGEAPECTAWNCEDELLDIELHFISGQVESAPVRRFLAASSAEPGDLVTVAVCRTQATLSLQTAMHLPPELRANNVPVYVHQDSDENLLRHNITIRRRAGRAGEEHAAYSNKLRRASAAYSNLYPVGCMENLFELHAPDFSLPKLFHRIYSCTAEQVERRQNGQPSGLSLFDALCRRGAATTTGLPQPLATAGSGEPGIWERFFAETIALDCSAHDGGKEMEKLPIILNWSNRYLAEAQEARRRQYPAAQGSGAEEQWASVLHWLPAFMEAEHQRWMAERLLNEDPLAPRNPNMVPLADIAQDTQYYDAFLCLATYLLEER